MNLYAVTAGFGQAAAAANQATENTGLTINIFWVIVAAANFIVFAIVIWSLFFKPVSGMLESRRSRIEQGLKDADQARRDREAAADERQKTLGEARREAADILARAQKAAEDERDRGIAETRAEIDRLREQAVSEIDAERQRALGEVRAQVADLALLAASKVVGESLNDERQRRLVEEFLTEVTPTAAVPAPAAAQQRMRRGRRSLMAASRSSARRYAEAAFEIASADGTLDEWLRDLKTAADAVGQPSAERLLGNPAVAVAVRVKAADDALGKQISDKALNLVRLLIRRGRIELLPQVARRYEELYERQKGIVRATITSAAPLDDAELRAIQASLERDDRAARFAPM